MQDTSQVTPLFSLLSLSGVLIPLMFALFILAAIMRLIVYWTMRRELWFVRELEKRVFRELSNIPATVTLSFFHFSKNILQKSYHEIFELRRLYKRRYYDRSMAINDQVFLIQEGVARLIIDVLYQARHLKFGHEQPNFTEMAKLLFENNKVFGSIFGIFSVNWMNHFLKLLPNLFVICGILGSFLGLMDGLPGLNNLDLADSSKSKAVMDAFLFKMALAMNTSALGIVFSICITLLNSIFGPETISFHIVARFASVMGLIWHRSSHNELMAEDGPFLEACTKLELEADSSVVFAGRFKADHQILSNAAYFPEYFKEKWQQDMHKHDKPTSPPRVG